MAAGGVPQFASLYVGDLHLDVTEAMLYEVFNSVGPVGSIRVCRDSVTRRSLGYGYVNFHSVGDAERALDTLNYSSIKGRSCRIMWSQRDPSLRKSGAGNVFVKNLDPNIDNKALYDTFSLFGNILSCKVSSDINGKSRGYGFVHYETEEAATQAISKVNGMQIGEKTVEVSLFLARNDRDTPDVKNFSNLYVKHFPTEWDEEKIKELFSPLGTVTSQCVMTDSRGRKFAFVNFEAPESAAKAVAELHDKDMRSEEQKKADEEAGKEMELGPDKLPLHLLYVGRAQSKTERQREMREKSAPDGQKPGQAQGVNLYVKNLDEATDDAQLRELFEPFGTVTSVASMVDDKGKCKGFGFVCFESPDEATKAVTEMHLKVVKGKPLYVGLAEKREARQERLRQRYTAGGSGGKGSSGKGNKGGGGGKGDQGGFGGMQGGGGGMQGGMMGGMGMQGMMPQQMMGMMRPQGMQGMMMPQMMGKGMPGMPQMMGGPQMMGKGGPMGMMNPQMMAMMQGKGGPAGGMPMMGKGMPGMMPGMMGMRPPMGQMPQPGMRPGGPGGPQMQPQPQPQPSGPGAPLTAAALASAPPSVQKQMLGEKLFPAIQRVQPEFAGKITGMMLEMDNSELLILLESEAQLKNKVDEAMRVLEVTK